MSTLFRIQPSCHLHAARRGRLTAAIAVLSIVVAGVQTVSLNTSSAHAAAKHIYNLTDPRQLSNQGAHVTVRNIVTSHAQAVIPDMNNSSSSRARRWGVAQAVPGAPGISGMSCAAPGDCTAGGGNVVVDEVKGSWGKPEKLRPALQGGHYAINSMSCSSPGNCAAAGSAYCCAYGGYYYPYVANEVNGTWGVTERLAGLAKLNSSPFGWGIPSMSCRSGGDCTAGGYYQDRSGHEQAFVVSEANSTWGNAKEVPGMARLNLGGSATVTSLSCGSPGNCSAGGYYTDRSPHQQTFVVNDTNGTWGKAKEVPATGEVNVGGSAEVISLSCGSPGNCSAGGYYTDRSGLQQAFVVNNTHGRWGKARRVSGEGILGYWTGGVQVVNSISCASAGNCSAWGYFTNHWGNRQVIVVSETRGVWGRARWLSIGSFLYGPGTESMSVSCGSPGNCSAGGYYTDGASHQRAFVIDEVKGVWGSAMEVPGTAKLDPQGKGAVTSVVSCASLGKCSAGGYYTDGSGHAAAFVVGS